MALSKIIEKITLGQWLETDLDDQNYAYLIAVKATQAQEGDVVAPKDVRNIIFELGIESGVTNKPLTIQRVVLNFNDEISPNNELNEIARGAKLAHLPGDKIYIKAISVDNGKEEIKSGTVNISVNINSMKLV
jgi:hypothetical protein